MCVCWSLKDKLYTLSLLIPLKRLKWIVHLGWLSNVMSGSIKWFATLPLECSPDSNFIVYTIPQNKCNWMHNRSGFRWCYAVNRDLMRFKSTQRNRLKSINRQKWIENRIFYNLHCKFSMQKATVLCKNGSDWIHQSDTSKWMLVVYI